jgi:hypothetical protein
MRTVPEVFKDLVKGKTYQRTGHFMCVALYHSLEFELITEEEADACRVAIHDFLGDNSTLHDMFSEHKWPAETEADCLLTEAARLKIYDNWEDREQIFDDFVNDAVNIGVRDRYISEHSL